MADLRTTVRDIQGIDISIIDAVGYIDTVTAPEMEQALHGIMERSRYKIIVDLAKIDYVSSAGWGVFVSEIRDLRDNNGDLVLIGMSPEVYDVYELMEFSAILKSFDKLEEALKYFGAEASMVDPSSSGPIKGQSNQPQHDWSEGQQKPKSESAQSAETNTDPAQAAHAASSEENVAGMSLNEKIAHIVKKNPYYSEKEIREELATPSYGSEKVGFFGIKKALKDLDLDSSKKRFDFANSK